MNRRERTGQGGWLCIAGPDGVGKSTVSEMVVQQLGAQHLHWRPHLLPALGELRGHSLDPTTPHARVDPPSRLWSAMRLVYFWADFVLGYWFRIRPATRRGGFVVMERGWTDMQVDRRRYGLAELPRLERGLSSLTPRADLYAVLEAPATTVSARKRELDEQEIDAQRRRWRATRPRARRVRFLDAGEHPESLAAKVLDDARVLPSSSA